MRYTAIILAVTSLAATIEAHTFRSTNIKSKRATTLEVTLASAETGDAGELVATIKNVGAADLNLLKVGTFIDEVLPVEKLLVTDEAGSEIPFRGIHASIQHAALTLDNFKLLKASESITTQISAAAVYEFAESGTYTFTATGLLPVAPAGSTELSGPAVVISSNSISIPIDASAAASVPKALSTSPLESRTNVADGCNATQLAASTASLSNCEALALAAAAEALDPSSARFVEYFKTNSSSTRQTVADRLTAVAKECSTTNSGPSRYFCYDYYGICETQGPLNAYTKWDFDFVIMCPLFYDTLPALPPGCHRQCQATTALHEMTHCEGVYSPHTNDFTYGYNETVALEPEFALINADTYSLFANAVYLKC